MFLKTQIFGIHWLKKKSQRKWENILNNGKKTVYWKLRDATNIAPGGNVYIRKGDKFQINDFIAPYKAGKKIASFFFF